MLQYMVQSVECFNLNVSVPHADATTRDNLSRSLPPHGGSYNIRGIQSATVHVGTLQAGLFVISLAVQRRPTYQLTPTSP